MLHSPKDHLNLISTCLVACHGMSSLGLRYIFRTAWFRPAESGGKLAWHNVGDRQRAHESGTRCGSQQGRQHPQDLRYDCHSASPACVAAFLVGG